MTAPTAKVRETVLQRAQGVCEGCGKSPANNLHHRKFRSRGGKHTVANLVLMCGSGVTGCHAIAHGTDAPEGWAVHSWETPERVPFMHHRFGLCYLADDGTVGNLQTGDTQP